MFFRREDARMKRDKVEVLAAGIRGLSVGAKPRPIVGRIQDQQTSLFSSHDVVLGCLDNIEARIHANAHSYAAGKVYIDGGTDGMLGRVFVAKPPAGACLLCGMNRSHAKIASTRFSCTGKGVVFHERKLAAEITTTSVVSAVMVRETLKAVSGRTDMLLDNAFYYDGQKNVAEELEISADPQCPVHPKVRRATGRREHPNQSRRRVGQ
jgi:molybdopterin/thiamine biosynthesis adenylyltransferase